MAHMIFKDNQFIVYHNGKVIKDFKANEREQANALVNRYREITAPKPSYYRDSTKKRHGCNLSSIEQRKAIKRYYHSERVRGQLVDKMSDQKIYTIYRQIL